MGKVGTSLARVARTTPDDEILDSCAEIARSLPGYFDEGGMENIDQDPREHELYLADIGGEAAGFATVERRDEIAEISWMATKPGLRGRGIGSALVAYVSEALRSAGVELLEIKTLAEEADYPSYEATRRFYEKAGFAHLETVDPYPVWGPENPCAIYVKVPR